MRISLLLASVFASLAVAQSPSTCASKPYYTSPAYGPSSGCVPTNYNSASDLGSTNPTDAASRCSQQCAAVSTCGAFVVQLNKAADSNNYSGTCFLYTSLPATPRSCADKPSQLIGGTKDNTGNCFSSSAAAASTFCSSYLGIGTVTVTRTAATPTTTVTTTTTQVSSAVSTIITSTTMSTSLTVTTSTLIQTSVATTTVSTTSTSTLPAMRKRAATSPAPACYSSVPASQLSAVCSCQSIASPTVTSTVTPTTITIRSIVTSSSTTISSTTTTASTTTTVSLTATATSSTSTTTTTTAVSVATVCPTPSGNALANPGFNDGTLNGWTVSTTSDATISITSDAECGPAAARFVVETQPDATTQSAQLTQSVTGLDATKTYALRLYKKYNGAGNSACIFVIACGIPNQTPFQQQIRQSASGNGYQLFSITCPSSTSALNVQIRVYCAAGASPADLDIDEASLAPLN